MVPTAGDVLAFWFDDAGPERWYAQSDDFDALVAERFGVLLAAATRYELSDWRCTPAGRLAEIIVLDQFSRNVWRGSAAAFAQDAAALVLAQEAIAGGHDAALPPARRAFFYLPFMHSESAVIHAAAITLFAAPGMENNLDFEAKHRAIIDRFGRYPHRNAALGRPSTPAEVAFLAEPGSAF